MNEALFQDKVAVITGAGIGIGFEIARQLATKGACVVLNDVDESVANQAVAKIQEEGGRCIAAVGDSSDLDFIQSMIDQAVINFGKLDFAIANAGITTFGGFLDYPLERFQRLVAVNLQGTFFLAQKAANQMIKQGSGGRILVMSSAAGYQYHPELTAYGMSKAAIKFLARSLGVDLAPQGITVNAIAPGATITERTVQTEGDYANDWSRITPTGRAATTEDIANAALFLLSPAASQITGQTILIDGGWTAVSPPP